MKLPPLEHHIDRFLAGTIDWLTGVADTLHFWSPTGRVPPEYRNPDLYQNALDAIEEEQEVLEPDERN